MANNRPLLTSKFIPQETVGDGNCAFNAFALGLCQADVLNHIGEKPTFYNELDVNKFIDLLPDGDIDWKEIKAALIQLRTSDPVRLQKIVAPALRALAAEQAKQDTDYATETLQALLAAYDDFKNPDPAAGPSDDIFLKHQCVKDFFAQAKSPDEVQNWWLDQGHKAFINEMAKDGEWAGDLELKQLGRIFGINVDVISHQARKENGKYVQDESGHIIRSEALHHVNFNHGWLPEADLSDNQIEELRARGIIGPSQNNRFPILLDLETLLDRSDPVPNEKAVAEFLKGDVSVVPKDWPQDCIDELVVRGVIRKPKGSPDYLVNQSLELKAVALARISAVDENLVTALLKIADPAQLPTMTLYNRDAAHYEYTEPLGSAPDLRQEDDFDWDEDGNDENDEFEWDDTEEDELNVGRGKAPAAVSSSKAAGSEPPPPPFFEILEADTNSPQAVHAAPSGSPSNAASATKSAQSSVSTQQQHPHPQTSPAAGGMFPPVNGKLTSPKMLAAIKPQLDKEKWIMTEVKLKNQTPYYSVTNPQDNNAEKFQIHEKKMTTEDTAADTFEVMLKCFRAAQPAGTLPKIATKDDAAKQAWKTALNKVYGDIKIDWDAQITIRTPAVAAKPASLTPGGSKV